MLPLEVSTHEEIFMILLMEDILHNLACIKNPAKNGRNYISTSAGFQLSTVWVWVVYVYMLGTHLSFVFPLKEGLFQLKQGTFGFQVYICKYIYICIYPGIFRHTSMYIQLRSWKLGVNMRARPFCSLFGNVLLTVIAWSKVLRHLEFRFSGTSTLIWVLIRLLVLDAYMLAPIKK